MKVLILSLLLLSSVCFGRETRSPIAVLDTGVNRTLARQPFMCKDGATNTVGYTKYDLHGHGSNIIGIISKNLDSKKYCILSIKVFHRYFRQGHSFWKYDVVKGLKIAIERKAKFINMSLYGPESDPKEKRQIQKALSKGIKILIAAGNKGRNLDQNCDSYPACYKLPGVHVVGSGYSNSNRNDKSNYGSETVTDWRDGDNIRAGGTTLSGTSQATAILTGELVKKRFTQINNRPIIDKRGKNANIQKQIDYLLRHRRHDNSMGRKRPSRRESLHRMWRPSIRGSDSNPPHREPEKALEPRSRYFSVVGWWRRMGRSGR